MGSDVENSGLATGRKMVILEELLLAFSVVCFFHLVYFLLAPYIWAQNLRFSPQEYTPWIRPWTREHDGIEIYALYLLMFCSIFSCFALSQFTLRMGWGGGRFLFRAFLLITTALFFDTIGFKPPMNAVVTWKEAFTSQQTLAVALVILAIISLFLVVHKYAAKVLLPLAGLLLIPLCFIATRPLSWKDYAFVFAPALRMINGAPLADIYFQYDLLLSLLAAAWMKLHLDLNMFQLVGRTTCYLLIFFTFIFSRKLLTNKTLSLFLFVALVLVKLYASPADPVRSLQVTPLRLDWWLPLLALAYFMGPYHWTVGIFCGMLILFHRNFGIIYSAAYCQLLVTLFFMDPGRSRGERGRATLLTIIREHILKSRNNLLVIIASTLCAALLFGGLQSKSADLYQKIGIGFLPIAEDSFFWYVPVLFSLVFLLLLKLSSHLSRAYLTAGFFLIYLAIGNSLYFFGRSHENNIINIAASLLLLFFLFLDLIERYLAEQGAYTSMAFLKSRLGVIVSLALVLSLVFSYGPRISERFSLQVRNAEARRLIIPPEVPKESLLDAVSSVRTITGGSKKVYFISQFDFLYYYYGSYSPTGYYNPLYSWVFNSDLARFLQGLLDNGYYLAADDIGLINEIVPYLHYTRRMGKEPFLVIWKE